MATGTLFGIGVGPGDPDLIPVKAVKVLSSVDVVFTAASSKNDYSLAVSIARPHLLEKAVIEKLDFPMSREKAVMEKAWRTHASRLAGVLEEGRDAAFLTLGDPLVYSTYGYVLRHLVAGWPHLRVLTIPGITSYQAAAAAINRPLVEGEETLLVMSGVNGGERFGALAEKPDNVVFMKAYRNVEGIRGALESAGMLESGVAVANCTMENECIYNDLSALSRLEPNYWTLVLAGKNRGPGVLGKGGAPSQGDSL